MKLNRKFLFFPAVAVGVIILLIMIETRPDVPTKPAGDRAKPVKVMTMNPISIAPEAIGFGQVAAKFEWKSIAEVSGKVVYRNPQLERGRVLKAGTEVLRIDPLDYELKLVQAKADLSSTQTQLKKLALENKNSQNSLKIERTRLKLANTELKRVQDLRNKKVASQSDVDTQQQAYLAQQKLVQDIENQIALYPDEKKVAAALIEVNRAKVKEAERSLEKTKVILPRDLRISTVDIELNQVVNMQQQMFTAQGLDVMEIEAQISIHDMQLLTQSLNTKQNNSTNSLPDFSRLTASVTLSSGHFKEVWPAKVVRVSDSIDSTHATVGVILEIKQTDLQHLSNRTLSMLSGMLVRAKIDGIASSSWAIPERALHGDHVYIFENNKLKILPVSVYYRRDQQVVVEGDLSKGDQLILNDLLPAISNMSLKLETVSDEPKDQEDAA
ncbi:acriflavin resistance protein [Vibrio sp. UCD-FRSSP16_10]|uniref:efflux RND transporter periplasmic adaptor subunit n=1 Tax=unclassified Vibrio TaxID=2614977 RepID=UPI000801D9B7|nr:MULTISPECIES: HlyD family efflux transporter periplasmic adaptor subunit [unclassified Vibrio]OBT16781.1 acriflavin resistance protein [Vibrio sp. UCD-FRSSP16_30]OBT21408.1 acriflavin resistance protein [Vibrio sp. UCD-FRSSP16_10]